MFLLKWYRYWTKLCCWNHIFINFNHHANTVDIQKFSYVLCQKQSVTNLLRTMTFAVLLAFARRVYFSYKLSAYISSSGVDPSTANDLAREEKSLTCKQMKRSLNLPPAFQGLSREQYPNPDPTLGIQPLPLVSLGSLSGTSKCGLAPTLDHEKPHLREAFPLVNASHLPHVQ